MDKQKVIISANLENALAESVSECNPDRLFVLMDETTERLCLPVVSHSGHLFGSIAMIG
jgi:3-dehydroquinate synthase